MSRKINVSVDETPMKTNEQMKFYIDNGISFMLHGPSGVGKSKRVEEIDPTFTSIVLRNGILPEEVIGKNIYMNDDAKLGGIWSPPAWYVSLCKKCADEPNKQHVLFIDEITNVKPTEQSLVFHLILNNSIGPNLGKLPENVVVVAAGNSKDESESAYNMPEPLFRRFSAHIYLKLNLTDWLEWVNEPRKGHPEQTKIHPLVSRFVATYAEKVFYSNYDPEEPPKYAIDPRGWEQVSDIIYNNKGVIRKELLLNKVGEQVAESFMAYAKHPPIMLEDVLEGNYSVMDIPSKFDQKFAMAMSFRTVDEENVGTVRKFIKNNLGSEILSTFDSAWISDDDEKAILISQQSLDEAEVVTKIDSYGNEKKDYKITFKEFISSNEHMAIYCKNEWQARKLCKMFDKMGRRWVTGESYVESNPKAEIYYTNSGSFYNSDSPCTNRFKMFEYSEVDFSLQQPKTNSNDKMLGGDVLEAEDSSIDGVSSKTNNKPSNTRQKYAMTLEEFVNNEKSLAIVFNSKEEVNEFSEAMKKIKKPKERTYDDGNALQKFDAEEMKQRCYINNYGTARKSFFETNNIHVYNFSEIDIKSPMNYLDGENLQTGNVSVIKPGQNVNEENLENNDKITLAEFFSNTERMAIHCNNESQANNLCAAFDKMGKKWPNGERYIDNTRYANLGARTCYTNGGTIGIFNFYINGCGVYKVFDYSEVDLGNQMDTSADLKPTNNQIISSNNQVLNGKTPHKINIDEFWKLKHRTAIHLETNDEMLIFSIACKKIGRKWAEDEYFAAEDWNVLQERFGKDVCIVNNGKATSLETCKKDETIIYQFNEIDFRNETNAQLESESYAHPQTSAQKTDLLPTIDVEIIKPSVEKPKNKITIKDFCDSEDKIAIHCDNQTEADELCKIFDSMGKTWASGVSYAEYLGYEKYKDQTCYINNGKFENVSYCEHNGIKVYDFDNIIIGNKNELVKTDELTVKQTEVMYPKHENISFDMEQYSAKTKISIEHFWKTKKHAAISCNSKEEGKLLAEVLKKMNKTYSIGIDKDLHIYYKRPDYNGLAFSNKGDCIKKDFYDCAVFDFYDVDIIDQLDQKQMKRLEKIIQKRNKKQEEYRL